MKEMNRDNLKRRVPVTSLGSVTTRLEDWARSFPSQDRKRHGVLLQIMKHARIVGGAPAGRRKLSGRDNVLKTSNRQERKKDKNRC